jgi:hypothetical protein
MDSFFGNVIDSYSRAQAIEDGMLIDITPVARKEGFKFLVALTDGVQSCVELPGKCRVRAVWCDILLLLRMKASHATDRVSFVVGIWNEAAAKVEDVRLYAFIGPGDTAAPVITIMLPSED